MNQSDRFGTIDALRGGAAVAVTLFHFNESYPDLNNLYNQVLKHGWLGVPIFFVVSGFCIAASCSKDRTTSFFIRRFLRIYPPYWASMIIVFAVVALRLMTDGVNDVTPLPKDLTAWFYTFAALTKPASSVAGINWVYWSLGYEVAFYLIVGLLAIGRRIMPLVAVSLVAFLLPLFPFDLWNLFAMGISSWWIVQGHYRQGLPLLIVSILFVATQLSIDQTIAASITFLLIVFPIKKGGGLLLAPFRSAGTWSYSLYLIHVPIGCYLLPRYLPFLNRRTSTLEVVLSNGFELAVCMFCAYLVYLFVERPSHEFARNISSRYRSTRHDSTD